MAERRPPKPSPRVEVFADLPPDSDPNILARAYQEVTEWARDRSREEIVAMLVETRADLLRARRDLRALARRLREIEERKAKRPAGGRGHKAEDAERMAAARELAEGMMRTWLADRWARWTGDFDRWLHFTPAEKQRLFEKVRAALPPDVDPDDRTLESWLVQVATAINYADLGLPGRLPPE
jgi:uncharacterized coiled-coil protein SlyX